MSFWVYSFSSVTGGRKFSERRPLPRSLPKVIGDFVESARSEQSGEWHLTSGDVLRGLKLPSETHALVTDLKPTDVKVSLYEFTDFWGLSGHDFLPLGVQMVTLFRDEGARGLSRQEFIVNDSAQPEVVREFLYLRRRGGAWRWGSTGNVNGALLFPQAWRSLVGRMDKQR